MSDDFVHLHLHTEYSLLDGLGKVSAMAKRAAELGQRALALTDHGTMHGAIEFSRACKGVGLKPLLGVEAYITQWGRPMTGQEGELDRGRHHLLLLAENMTGYRNLLQICSDAQLKGYYYRPRVDAEYLAAHSEGLICTSGCLAAELPTLIKNGQEHLAVERLMWYRDVFGPDHWYIEFQEHSIPELTEVNKQLWAFAQKYDVPVVVTNDVHYVREEDWSAHDLLLCVQTSSLLTDPKRMRYDGRSYFLKNLDQMRQTFLPYVDMPDSAFSNTVKIAEMCSADPDDKHYHLPDIEVPEGFNYETYLRHLTDEGLTMRYGARADDPEVQARKNHELKVIHEMGFDVYYLIVWDLCMYAKRRGIWWNVRGSGAGSIVAYAIEVTNLDPLRNKLIFERFLNPGRVTMPDFDLDFPDDQREELIRYTLDKYGDHRVAQVVTFGRMKARAAVRDVGRAMGVPLDQVDIIAKMIPGISGKPVTIQDVLTPDTEFYSADLKQKYETDDTVRGLLDAAKQLEGVARHSSIHPAAVMVADRELTYYTPLMRPPKSAITQTVTQYEYPILESIGLLKIDFLGLSTLTLMREATRLIKERHGIEYTLLNLPIDDPKTYDLLTAGDVMGVFQVEGQGMRRVLMDMRPTEFDHITATISLYRPGPMEFIPDFIACLHGEKKPEYVHKVLEPILSETMGVCVSGDSLVLDARTGKRYRLDEVVAVDDFVIQGVDEHWCSTTGRVTHWIDSGFKQVYKVTLRNGAQIKVTPDHRLLTENGWRPLSELKVGDYVGTPPHLFGSDGDGFAVDRRKLRVLGYLIADGSLTSGTMVDFVSKEPAMLDEYRRCLAAFPDIITTQLDQVHGVTRVGVAKDKSAALHYHTPNSLLRWLRDLGMKYEPGSKPGGLHSRDKSVPDFVFELPPDEIAFFLASLWDGDGYMGDRLCHYRTISSHLAEDVRTLLLRLGISATIHTNYYTPGSGQVGQDRIPSYQVTVYDTARLATLLQPHMVSSKRSVVCDGVAVPTVSRAQYMRELTETWKGTQKGLMRELGFDRQHFRKDHSHRTRIPGRVVNRVAHELELRQTVRNLNVSWQSILSIEPAGVEHVYDLTVEGLHSFVANGVIVHNCVYQEQVIQILADIAGYTPGEADLVRRGISKKSKKTLDEHREIFANGSAKVAGLKREEADAIWDALMGFARYGFNRAHAADYAVVVAQTGYLKAHYPVEYMAALLTVERHDTEKVGVLIAECRRMGIEVLPPSINVSGHMFTVEKMAGDRTPPRQTTAFPFPVEPGVAIRMGLDAIKNLGEGPVDVVLKARGKTPFASLADFAERVDLREINRRSLECLVKVGALDDFAPRARLLAAIDNIMQASVHSHEAAEVGQLTLFGEVEAVSDDEILGPVSASINITPKEILEWEKELVGVYVSSHPLQRMTVDLMNTVTHSTVDITEELNGKSVVIAGMLAEVRPFTTKKGDSMAFMRLEDLQGTVDVTVFPQLFRDRRSLCVADKIVIVWGKVDFRNGRVSVVADIIQDYVEGAKPIEDTTSLSYRFRNGSVQTDAPLIRDRRTSNGANGNGVTAPARFPAPPPPPARRPVYEEDEEDMPGSDDNPFASDMPDWMMDNDDSGAVSASKDVVDVSTNPVEAIDELAADPPVPVAPVDQPALLRPDTPSYPVNPITPAPPARPPAVEPVQETASIPPPPVPLPAAGPKTIRITFRRSHTLEGDRRRLSEIVDLLERFAGEDRYVIELVSKRERYQLEFPSNYTRVCRDLQNELTQRLGANCWRLE